MNVNEKTQFIESLIEEDEYPIAKVHPSVVDLIYDLCKTWNTSFDKTKVPQTVEGSYFYTAYSSFINITRHSQRYELVLNALLKANVLRNLYFKETPHSRQPDEGSDTISPKFLGNIHFSNQVE